MKNPLMMMELAACVSRHQATASALDDAVIRALDAGETYEEVAVELGMSKQACHKLYSPFVHRSNGRSPSTT